MGNGIPDGTQIYYSAMVGGRGKFAALDYAGAAGNYNNQTFIVPLWGTSKSLPIQFRRC